MGYSQIYTHFPQGKTVEKSVFLSFPQATVLWEMVDKKYVTNGLQ